jgi:hypothetical protein
MAAPQNDLPSAYVFDAYGMHNEVVVGMPNLIEK